MIGFILGLGNPKRGRSLIRSVGAAALIGAGLPILAVTASLIVGPAFQKSDVELYREIFGYHTTMVEQDMLFDDFGHGTNREIFMRAYPDEEQRQRMLSIPGLTPSNVTISQFAALGDEHGFMWWIEVTPNGGGNYCRSARILEAHGFERWRKLLVAECLDGGGEFPASANAGKFFVVASGRDR